MSLQSLPRFRSVLLLFSLLLVFGCDDAGGGLPAAGAPVARPAFSADRAFAYLRRQVEFGPRIPGEPGHQAQLEWMQQFLRERADTVFVQPFSYVTSTGDTLRLTNLMARFQPGAGERVLLVAHWDTRPRADQSARPADRSQPVPGANDGASGVAVLLELAEMFRTQPPPVGVDLLFVDGEDYGPSTDDMFLGARHFAANQPAGYNPLYGVLLDMVGDQNPRFPIEGNSEQYAPEVVRRVWEVARELGYGDIFVESPGGFISDDHVPLNEAGIRTIDVIDFEYGPGNRFWHTPDDVPANTSAETLRIVGEVMAELVYRGG